MRPLLRRVPTEAKRFGAGGGKHRNRQEGFHGSFWGTIAVETPAQLFQFSMFFAMQALQV